MFAVIGRCESLESEQLCQLTSIYAVVLTTVLEQMIVFGIVDNASRNPPFKPCLSFNASIAEYDMEILPKYFLSNFTRSGGSWTQSVRTPSTKASFDHARTGGIHSLPFAEDGLIG
jgi:hypothetical protein